MVCRIVAAILVCVCTAGAAFGDVVRLKTGGELRGKLVKTSAAVANIEVSLETLSGAMVVLPREDVGLVIHRPLSVEEYETRLRNLPDTAEAHRDLADWCKSKNLTEQRRSQLARVVQLAPDDERSHLALGHVWKDGAWVDLDDYMAARGYVKHKGRYITQQEFELQEKTREELKREQEWYPKVRLWTGWMAGLDADRAQQGMTALRSIQDDDASPAIAKFLGEHAAQPARSLGVEVLSHSAGPKSAKSLVRIMLREEDNTLRYAALQGIAAEQYPIVQPILLRELRNANNAVVCRAGQGLARVGDDRAIPQLIDSLITTHEYAIRVPGGGTSASFGMDGSMGGGGSVLPPGIEAGLRTGQYPNGVIVLNTPGVTLPQRTVMVTVDHQNAAVLDALQKLTGENYGYDERLWRLWWAAKKAAG